MIGDGATPKVEGCGSLVAAAAVLACLVVCAAPWAFGAVEPLWWCPAALGCLLPAIVVLLSDAVSGKTANLPREAEWLPLLLPLLPIITLVPLPVGLVTMLSPGYETLFDAIGGPPPGAWRTLSAAPRETLHAALIAAACAAVFWLFARAARAERMARVLTSLLLLLGAALAVFGLVQRVVDYRWQEIYWSVPLSEVGTPFGPFVNRNHFGGAMCMFVGLSAGALLEALARRRLAGALFPAATLVLVLVALVATTSRGAILALGVCALTIAFCARGGSRWKLVVIGLAVGAALLGALEVLGVLGDLQARLFRVSGRAAHRFAVQLDAARTAAEFPVFGTGAGSFEDLYPPFQTVRDVRTATNAHSDWIQWAMETGLAGMLLAAAIVWRFLRRSLGAALAPTPVRWAVAGPLAGIAGVSVHGFFDVNLHIPSNALLMAATLSLAYAASLRVSAQEVRDREPPANAPDDEAASPDPATDGVSDRGAEEQRSE